MFPRFSNCYSPYTLFRNSKSIGENGQGIGVWFVEIPYLLDVFILELCFMVKLSDWRTSFADRIKYVLSVCSNPDMFWVYTRRIVAGMAAKFSIWYLSHRKLVRHSMCSFERWFDPKSSVSIFVFVRLPLPAFIWFSNLHLAPESLFNGLFFGHPNTLQPLPEMSSII